MNKTETEKIVSLALTDICPSPTNPRKTFHQYELEELAVSLKERGVIEPIIVRLVSTIENEEHRKAATARIVQGRYGQPSGTIEFAGYITAARAKRVSL
jgi:hypothetical protein